MSRALALAGCGVLSVSVAACESTEQESARIGRENAAAAKLADRVDRAAEAAHRTHHAAPVHTTTNAKGTSAP